MRLFKYLGFSLIVIYIIISLIYIQFYGLVPYQREVKRVLSQLYCNNYMIKQGTNPNRYGDPLSGIDNLNAINNYCYISSSSSWRCDYINVDVLKRHLSNERIIVAGRRIKSDGYDIWILKKDGSIEHNDIQGQVENMSISYDNTKCGIMGLRTKR